MRTRKEQEEIRLRLEQLENRSGRLTPAAVLDDARSPKSPLHKYIEWDQKKAAYQHQLDQCRELIRSVKVTYHTETTHIRAIHYWRDPHAAATEQGYVSITKLRTDADLSRDALVEAFQYAADKLRRARELAIALDMVNEVQAFIDSLDEFRRRLDESPPPPNVM
jgi:hypothetical protein